MKPILLTFFALLAAAFPKSLQAAEEQPRKDKAATSGELFETISRLDSAVFAAFNAHDVDLLMSMFTDDLEFYHDVGGLTDFPQTRENFKTLFTRTPDIRRDLVKGSLEVYPIKDHGALAIGAHQFCHQENGKDDCGTFKFAMVWRKSGERWKLARVISYAH